MKAFDKKIRKLRRLDGMSMQDFHMNEARGVTAPRWCRASRRRDAPSPPLVGQVWARVHGARREEVRSGSERPQEAWSG